MIVLVPMIKEELDHALNWLSRAKPAFRNPATHTLVFSIDRKWDLGDKGLLKKQFTQSRLQGMRLEFIECDIPASQSVYLKNDKDRRPVPELPFGKKSGPNLQFFESLTRCMDIDRPSMLFDYLMLCEVDTATLFDFWADKIASTASSAAESFFIAGAKPGCKAICGDTVKNSFNGNALYNIGDPRFANFLSEWREATKFANRFDCQIAYDFTNTWLSYCRDKDGSVDTNKGQEKKLSYDQNDELPFKVASFISAYEENSIDISWLIYNDNKITSPTSADFPELERFRDTGTVALYHGPLAKLHNSTDEPPSTYVPSASLTEQQASKDIDILGDSSKPLLSIVTVVLNDPKGLDRTCRSIRTVKEVATGIGCFLEFVLIDGASSDSTLDIASLHSDIVDKLVSEEDQGTYFAMNKGVRLASGRYLIFMNAGDTFCSDFSLTEFAAGLAASDSDVLYGDRYYVTGGEKNLQKAKPISLLHQGMCYGHQAAFYSRRALLEYSFNTNYRFAADYHQVVRLYLAGKKFCYISSPVCDFYAGGLSESGPQPYMEAITIQFNNFSDSEIRESRYLGAFLRNVKSIFADYIAHD